MASSEVEPGAVEEVVNTTLALDPGEQSLVSTEARRLPLSSFPDVAFENLLIVSVGRHPREVAQRLEDRGIEPRTVGVVPVTASEVSYDGPLWLADRVAPSDLTGISIQTSRGVEHLEPGKGWIIVDDISTLLMYAEESRVFRLLAWLANSARENDLRGVYAVERDVITPRTYDRFRGLCDSGQTVE